MKTTEGFEPTKWEIDEVHSEVGFNVKLNLQLRGILNYSRDNEGTGFTVTGKINRSNWGLPWNIPTESSGLMVNDEVEISCKIELIKVFQKVVFTPEGLDTFFQKVS